MQKAEGIKFSKVAVDHCIEQTFNRDTRTRGGITGFSLKKGVVEKWIPSAHARAALTNECRQLAGLKVATAVTNKDTQISKIKRDEKMVQNVCDVLQDIKSLSEISTELFKISSGVVADKAIAADILGAKKTGKDASEKFAEMRLVKGVVEFFDLITKNNLKSFGTVAKQVKANLKNWEISVKADRSHFCKTHCDGTKSQLQTCEMCCHIPWDLYFSRLL